MNGPGPFHEFSGRGARDYSGSYRSAAEQPKRARAAQFQPASAAALGHRTTTNSVGLEHAGLHDLESASLPGQKERDQGRYTSHTHTGGVEGRDHHRKGGKQGDHGSPRRRPYVW